MDYREGMAKRIGQDNGSYFSVFTFRGSRFQFQSSMFKALGVGFWVLGVRI